MCEFCEGKRSLLFYDNGSELKSHQGVSHVGTHVQTRILLRGDHIVNEISTNHRTEMNCHVLATDDISDDMFFDNLGYKTDVTAYVKIRFCPFCGRELENGSFEIEDAKLNIEPTRREIARLKKLLDEWHITIQAQIHTQRKDWSKCIKDGCRMTDEKLKAYVDRFDKNSFDATTKITYYAKMPDETNLSRQPYDKDKMFDELTFCRADGKDYVYRTPKFRISDEDLSEFIKTNEVYNSLHITMSVHQIHIDKIRRDRERVQGKIVALEEQLKGYEKLLNINQ